MRKRYVDNGHEETEAILRAIERRISTEYNKAAKDLSDKLNDYLMRFAKKDALKLKALAAGEITLKQYQEWYTGQVMIGKRWAEMLDTIAEDLTNADDIARSVAFGYIPEIYAINHNYGTFQVERGGLVDTSYTLYDKQTVERLVLDDRGDFVPKPGKRVSRHINAGKTLAWNKQQAQSVMMQAILQGESIGKIASRLETLSPTFIMEDIKGYAKMTADEISKILSKRNRAAAIRNARTLATGVQNAGRMDSYDRARSMGIKVKKAWLATLDSRTRHWHRELDGETVDIDKPFENDYGEIMYPGDPEADPANIYNCRCTLVAQIAGFEHDMSDLTERNVRKLGDMTYEEWKNEKESTSDPIDKQDQIAEHMKRVYGAEYRRYARL